MEFPASLMDVCKEVKMFKIRDGRLFFVMKNYIISSNDDGPNFIDLNSNAAREDNNSLIQILDNTKPYNYKALYQNEFGAQSLYRLLLDEALEKASPFMKKRPGEVENISDMFKTSMNKMFAAYFAGMSEVEIKEKLKDFRYNQNNISSEAMINMIESGTQYKTDENQLFLSVKQDDRVLDGQPFSMFVKPNEDMQSFLRAFSFFQHDLSQVFIVFGMNKDKLHSTMQYHSLFGGISMTEATDGIIQALQSKKSEFIQDMLIKKEQIRREESGMKMKYGI